MDRRFTPVLLVWAVLLLVAGAVSVVNHSDEKQVATDGRPGQSTTTAPGGAIAGEGTVTLPGATDAPADSAATDGQTGGAGGDDNPTIDAGTGGGGGGGGAAARIMPTPGTYTVNVSGSASVNGAPQSIPPQNSFQIIQESETDQRQTGDFETLVRWAPEGASLVRFKIGQAGKEFVPAQPLLYVPFDGTTTEWSWSPITSTDGKTTIEQSSRIVRNETVDVGGQPVSTFVVESVLTFKGDLVGSANLTSWVSPDYRLAVQTHTIIDATFNALLRLRSDTTSVLVSLTPS
jgi:hypothetical protein